jgi:hypothetical protein
MRRIITTFDSGLSVEVIPVVRPTVPIADRHSYAEFMNGSLCAQRISVPNIVGIMYIDRALSALTSVSLLIR